LKELNNLLKPQTIPPAKTALTNPIFQNGSNPYSIALVPSNFIVSCNRPKTNNIIVAITISTMRGRSLSLPIFLMTIEMKVPAMTKPKRNPPLAPNNLLKPDDPFANTGKPIAPNIK